MELTEYQRADLLLRFIDIGKEGMVKPNDVTQAVRKLDELKNKGIDIGQAIDCCTSSNVVRDAIDFKPYVMAATRELFKILKVNVHG